LIVEALVRIQENVEKKLFIFSYVHHQALKIWGVSQPVPVTASLGVTKVETRATLLSHRLHVPQF